MTEIKLLVLDVDGVLTNGTKIYDRNGLCTGKIFCDQDFTAIKKFKAAGIPVVFLSGDIFNKGIAEKRNIDFFCSRDDNGMIAKNKVLVQIIKKYDVLANHICYVGDDIFDLDVLKMVGHPYRVEDCAEELMNFPGVGAFGGECAVSSLFKRLQENGLIANPSLNAIIECDRQESF